MSIWGALAFMALGAVLMGLANAMSWKKYYEGRREESKK